MLLGLDIGGTKSAALLGDQAGQVIARRQWPSEAARGPDAMLKQMNDEIAILRREHPDAVEGIGVAVGGPLDMVHGIVHSTPNLPGWVDVPLRALLEEAWRAPVSVLHDAAACALAESWWGAGIGCARVAYLTCGTGFGVGLVIDGKPYVGARGASMEIGHVRYRPDGPTAFGVQGCYEAWCAGSSLPKLAAWKYPRVFRAGEWSGERLQQAAANWDAEARQILRLNAEATGSACALLSDLLAPDVILLGSLARYLGDGWVADVRKGFAANALARPGTGCRIAPAGLGERLQDMSALAAARWADTAG
jgi:glucokinase